VRLPQALRAIASKLESAPDMLTPAVHSSAMDFLMNRLPPHPKQLPSRGTAPTMEDRVWCRVAGWAYLLPFELTGMNCDDDDDDAGGREGCWLGMHACCWRLPCCLQIVIYSAQKA
jgi:lysine-specific demethylase/histidyl-hydroxylase NO66